MRALWIVLLVVAAVAVVAGIASNAYQTGLARGQAESSRAAPPQTGAPGPAPYPYYYGPSWHGPFGFGFFGFLFPLLFIFLVFALIRGAFWGWHGRWDHGPGAWKPGGVPPAFEEWHRRAHESGPQGQKM